MVVKVVYDNSRNVTIHDAALWSCALLEAKRAMLVFVMKDDDDDDAAAMMIKRNRAARAINSQFYDLHKYLPPGKSNLGWCT